MEPKISNFKYSRALQGDTVNIGDIAQIVRWLAPEKMNSKKLNQQVASNSTHKRQKKKVIKRRKKKIMFLIPFNVKYLGK